LKRGDLKVAVIGLALLAACASAARYAPGRHYFQGANLYVDPPIPRDEISEERARQLKKAGLPYYEAEYDAGGKIVRFTNHGGARTTPAP
jgi:hypothetical protein